MLLQLLIIIKELNLLVIEIILILEKILDKQNIEKNLFQNFLKQNFIFQVLEKGILDICQFEVMMKQVQKI